MFASAIVVFALWYDATRARFVAFIVTYGIFSGGYNALLPATIVELYGDESYDQLPESFTSFVVLGRYQGHRLPVPS